MPGAPILAAMVVGAAVGGISAAITGGNIGKGAVFGGIIGAVTTGVGSAISTTSNAGSAAGGATGGTASSASSLGTVELGKTTLGNTGFNVAGSEIAGLAETSNAALSSLGAESSTVAGLGSASSSAGVGAQGSSGGLLGGASESINSAQGWAGEEIAKGAAVKGGEKAASSGLWDTAKDWWGGMDAAKQGNWMELAGDTVGGIGKGLLSGMQAEDERSWREKMYERMQRDNTIDFNRNDTPSTQGYRVADNYQAIPRWLQDRIGRK